MQEPSLASDTALDWEPLRPALDQAMHELNETDREAVLLRYVAEFGWERPLPYPRRVRLCDAEHIINRTWPKPRTGRSLRRHRVGRRDVRDTCRDRYRAAPLARLRKECAYPRAFSGREAARPRRCKA